jgi:hypothetical protein
MKAILVIGGLFSVFTFCLVGWKNKGDLSENWAKLSMLLKRLPEYLNTSRQS